MSVCLPVCLQRQRSGILCAPECQDSELSNTELSNTLQYCLSLFVCLQRHGSSMVVKCVRILNSPKPNVCLSVCLSVYTDRGGGTESTVCQASELSNIKCLSVCLSVYRHRGVLRKAWCVRILNSPILNVWLPVCLFTETGECYGERSV